MAVVTARRLRADRVAKDRNLPSLTHDDSPARRKMSYPVPSQPPGASDQVSITSPNPIENFPLPQGGSSGDSLKKRKASRSKAPPDLRRSASTPHLGKIGHDSGILSPTSDKRRNKLGYHRTSIACSHCRRRKIRCQIPIPDDPQGRCTNCIRLKKECVFYSVDQAAAIENKSSHPSKKDIGGMVAPSNSSQSSPHISGASQPGSVADDAQAHIHSPKINPEGQQHHDIAAFGMPAATGANVQTAPFPYTNQVPGPWASSPQSVDQFQHRPSIPDSQYWSVSSTPTTSHYSHDPVASFNPTTPSAFNPNFAYTQSSNPAWAPPTRSMSFGNIEGMAQQVNYQGYQYSGPHPDHQSGYSIQQPSQYTHPATIPQSINGALSHTVKSEGIPRSWSAAPALQGPPTSSAQTTPVLPSSFYPQQQTFVGYDQRSDSNYNQSPQFYAPVSHPG